MTEVNESLSRNESNLDKIFIFLQSEKAADRQKATIRLTELFMSLTDKDSKLVINKLSKSILKEKNVTVKNLMQRAVNDYIKFPTLEARKEEKKRRAKEKKFKEKAEEERLRLKEEKRKKEKEAEILRKSKIMAEQIELSNYTYITKESKTRLPMFSVIQAILRLIAVLYLLGGIVLAIITIDEVGVLFGVAVIGLTTVMCIQLFFLAEVLTFVTDFHDVNHINSKVRIETLKVLKEISENLKK